MRGALLLVLLGWVPPSWVEGGRFDRVNSRCVAGRSDRGLECSTDNFAFFEFAPSNGAGMGSACACTTPTGAKGEAMTFTRTGDATCSRSGLATTGIQNGDLVTCAADLPRVEPSGGVLGLRVEGARTFSLLRFIDIANALWANVATPTLTGGQASPWTGALSTSAVQMDDNNAAAQEGRSQTVTVTAAVAHTMHCYVKAGTLTSAAISLDGTVATITGLVTTSWSIVEVVDASSSGVAISAQILNGSTAAGTGTVIWGGCAVEQGSYRTSIMPTVASAVTRNADDAYFNLATFTLGNLSLAATAQTPSTAPVRRLHGALTKAPDDGVNFIASYKDGATWWGQFTSTAGTSTWNTTIATTTGPVRAASYIDGANVGGCINGTCATNPIGTFNSAQITNPRRLRIGAYSTTNGNIDGVATRVCLEPNDPTRCR